MFAFMTIREAYQNLLQNLVTTYPVNEAAIMSDWVLEHSTGIRKTDPFSQKEKLLGEAELLQLQDALKRLLEYEPVQYVLNEAWFCGLKLYVDHRVLIPRPETEELIEWVISDCKFPIDKLSILDIGTGSGCIALALKKRLSRAEVTGCDVSEEALSVAKKNGETLGIEVNFMQVNFLDPAQGKSFPGFDIIISNPPYIAQSESASMHANVLEHEPSLALFVPDEDALVFYRSIAQFGLAHLNPGGKIYVEINEQLGADTKSLFGSLGYSAEIKKDMQGKDRMVKAWIN
jgi:release factor glutamine methyltransferase